VKTQVWGSETPGDAATNPHFMLSSQLLWFINFAHPMKIASGFSEHTEHGIYFWVTYDYPLVI
jgi:hypothetical protein